MTDMTIVYGLLAFITPIGACLVLAGISHVCGLDPLVDKFIARVGGR